MWERLRNLRLATRLMLNIGLILTAVVGVVTAANIARLDRVIAEAEERELSGHFAAIEDAIRAEARVATALSALVAALPPVHEAFEAGDREGLNRLLNPAFNSLKRDHQVVQLQFHTAPATSFLRVHKPQEFGDDLSGYRHTVVEANRRLSAVTGLENGAHGLGVRGVVPVVGARHLGTVEFGMNFGQPFFEAQESVTSAGEAGTALTAIDAAVLTITDMNTQIAAAEEQAAVADEIHRNITRISQVADETASGAQSTARASEDLAQATLRLRGQLARFRV